VELDDIVEQVSRGVAPKGLKHALKIDLGDAGCVRIDGTQVTYDDGPAETTVCTTVGVLAEVISGRIDFAVAYYEGRAEIHGSRNLAMQLTELLTENGLITPVRRFKRTIPPDEIADALRSRGAVIIEDCVPAEVSAAVASELRPHFDRYGDEHFADFEGYKTLRLGEILARSRTSAELIGEPLALRVVDEILLGSCINYRIGSCTGIEILSGETQQPLHRDDGIYPVAIQGMELQVSVMWALTEFTVNNGATHLIPGSHRGPPRDLTDQPEATVQAPMAPGSALLYLGSMLHGGGANQSTQARMGLVNTYALGWLRQEENHILSIPREIAESYPKRIRELMGYQTHGPLLGTFPTREYDWDL